MSDDLNYSLVKAITDDEIVLTGLYKQGDEGKGAFILLHGFERDFYTQGFLHVIANRLHDKGMSVLIPQTRGTGLWTKFNTASGGSKVIGSYYELLEEAYLDIDAWIKLLVDYGHNKFTLAGHSLGTVKAVRYLFEGNYSDQIENLVLLAPFDKNAFIEKKAGDKWSEFLKNAQDKVKKGEGMATVPVPEYEDYPMSYQTFVSWYNLSEMSCMFDFYRSEDYSFPVLNRIKVPTLVAMGDADEFVDYPEFDVNPRSVLEVFNNSVSECKTSLLDSCGHEFAGKEELVAKEVVEFVDRSKD